MKTLFMLKHYKTLNAFQKTDKHTVKQKNMQIQAKKINYFSINFNILKKTSDSYPVVRNKSRSVSSHKLFGFIFSC